MSWSGLTAATASGCLDLARLKRLKGRSVGSGVSWMWMTSSPCERERENKTYYMMCFLFLFSARYSFHKLIKSLGIATGDLGSFPPSTGRAGQSQPRALRANVLGGKICCSLVLGPIKIEWKRLWKQNGLKETPWYFNCSSNSWISWLTRSIRALSLDLPDPEDGNFLGGCWFRVTSSPTEAFSGTPSGSKSLGLSWDPMSDISSSSSRSLLLSRAEAGWSPFFISLIMWNNLRTLGSLVQPQCTKENISNNLDDRRIDILVGRHGKSFKIFSKQIASLLWNNFEPFARELTHPYTHISYIYICTHTCHKACGMHDSFRCACTSPYECASMIKNAYVYINMFTAHAGLSMYAGIPASDSWLSVWLRACRSAHVCLSHAFIYPLMRAWPCIQVCTTCVDGPMGGCKKQTYHIWTQPDV